MNVYSQIATQIFEIRINQNFSSPISRAKGCSKKFKKQIVFLGNLLKKGSEQFLPLDCSDAPLMTNWISEKKRRGTALAFLHRRCCAPAGIPHIRKWKRKAGLPELSTTAEGQIAPGGLSFRLLLRLQLLTRFYEFAFPLLTLPPTSLIPSAFCTRLSYWGLKKKKKKWSASSVSLDCCPPRSWGLSECHSEREQGAL